jgi:hypothetical protein
MADLITTEDGGACAPDNAANQVLVDLDGAAFPSSSYGMAIQNLHATKAVEVSRHAGFTYGTGIRIAAAGGVFVVDEMTHGKIYVRTGDATAVDVRVFPWRKAF